MKMSRSTGEQRMAVSRSRPARRREGGASRGFAMALWATKMRAAPHRPESHCGYFCSQITVLTANSKNPHLTFFLHFFLAEVKPV